MVAAVQLDQGPMNTRQLRMQLIGSVVLGQDGVNGFGRGGIQGLPWGGGWGGVTEWCWGERGLGWICRCAGQIDV